MAAKIEKSKFLIFWFVGKNFQYQLLQALEKYLFFQILIIQFDQEKVRDVSHPRDTCWGFENCGPNICME